MEAPDGGKEAALFPVRSPAAVDAQEAPRGFRGLLLGAQEAASRNMHAAQAELESSD